MGNGNMDRSSMSMESHFIAVVIWKILSSGKCILGLKLRFVERSGRLLCRTSVLFQLRLPGEFPCGRLEFIQPICLSTGITGQKIKVLGKGNDAKCVRIGGAEEIVGVLHILPAGKDLL